MDFQSSPRQPRQRLSFCNDCGSLRLCDVTNQLQELFTAHDVNPALCGICNKIVQPVAQVEGIDVPLDLQVKVNKKQDELERVIESNTIDEPLGKANEPAQQIASNASDKQLPRVDEQIPSGVVDTLLSKQDTPGQEIESNARNEPVSKTNEPAQQIASNASDKQLAEGDEPDQQVAMNVNDKLLSKQDTPDQQIQSNAHDVLPKDNALAQQIASSTGDKPFNKEDESQQQIASNAGGKSLSGQDVPAPQIETNAVDKPVTKVDKSQQQIESSAGDKSLTKQNEPEQKIASNIGVRPLTTVTKADAGVQVSLPPLNIVKQSGQRRAIKTEPRNVDIDDDDDDNVGGGGWDNDTIEHDDAESSNSFVDIPLQSVSAMTSRISDTVASTKLTSDRPLRNLRVRSKVITKTRKSKVTATKSKTRKTNVVKRKKKNDDDAELKIKCEPPVRNLRVKVTRLSSGAIKAANYDAMFGRSKSDDDDEQEEEDDDKDEDEEEEEESANDDDSDDEDFHISDDGEGDGDEAAEGDIIDLSTYLVPDPECEPAENTNDKSGPGVDGLVPALRQLVVPGDDPNKQHKCKLCGDEFRYISTFQKHADRYHSEQVGTIEEPFVCSECGRTTKSAGLLMMHKKKVHLRQRMVYKCKRKNCNFTFKRRDQMLNHIEVHKGNKQFVCKKCGVGFHVAQLLNIHKGKHSKKQAYSCKYCGKSFGHSHYLNIHIWQHENGDRYKCDSCEFASYNQRTVKNHQMRFHSNKHEPLKCTNCKRTFTSKLAFVAHSRFKSCEPVEVEMTLTPDEFKEVTKNVTKEVAELMGPVANVDTPYRCKHCRMTQFKSAILFLKHVGKAHAELYPDIDKITEPYRCSECGHTFPKFSYLSQHQKRHTEARPHKCEHPGCTKSFKTIHEVRTHQIVHKDKQYMCNQCGKFFRTKPQLYDHERCVHQDLRPFPCSYCDKSFSKKDKVVAHEQRIHLKLKPWVCDQCGRPFADRRDLNLHMRHHTGEKPFACDQCDYRAVRSDYMKKHKRTHTGERPYHCDLCNTTFAHRTQYVAHKKKVHGIDEGSGTSSAHHTQYVAHKEKIHGIDEGGGSASASTSGYAESQVQHVAVPVVTVPVATTNMPLSSILSASHMVVEDVTHQWNQESKHAVQFLHQNYHNY